MKKCYDELAGLDEGRAKQNKQLASLSSLTQKSLVSYEPLNEQNSRRNRNSGRYKSSLNYGYTLYREGGNRHSDETFKISH